MIPPDHTVAGSLADADGLALMIPRDRHERHFLVTSASDVAMAVMICDPSFLSFSTDGAENWRGLIISEIAIELDETTAFDADEIGVPFGAMVRRGSKLVIRATNADTYGDRRKNITVIDGLPAGSEFVAVGFQRWKIVTYVNNERHELYTVDVSDRMPTSQAA